MIKSFTMWLSRRYGSFTHFTKSIIRWPRSYISMYGKMLKQYDQEHDRFKERVDALPNWIPLKLRIGYRVINISWSLASMDLSVGWVGMYRVSIINKITNDLVVNMVRHGSITNEVYNEFADREIRIKAGNFSGHGRVWDFYDFAYSGFNFKRPYESVLNSLSTSGLIPTTTHEKYQPIVLRLDLHLRENNAIAYQGSLAYAILENYDDHYYRSKINRDLGINLNMLLEMERTDR